MAKLINDITSIENLFLSWKNFRKGKRHKPDVQQFERYLEDNLFQLRQEFKTGSYRHGNYISFNITDPKSRLIHKAKVRDRVVHHGVYRQLYPIFDKGFIFDSYSCRNNKGTHRAIKRLRKFTIKVSKNNIRVCWALKLDVKKFFNSVDQQILLKLISKKIKDRKALSLIDEIIGSFSVDKKSQRERERELRGLPIGNLTSQLFANIYLNPLDQFVKHELKEKYYLRYCDDFVILSKDRKHLIKRIFKIEKFLSKKLKLNLHPDKIILTKLKQGIDFLGYVVLPHSIVLRTKTKKRMLNMINESNKDSYLGLLKHCDSYKLKQRIRSIFD